MAFETWTDLAPPHGYYRSWYYVFYNCGGDCNPGRLIDVMQRFIDENASPMLTVFEAPQVFLLPLTPGSVDLGIEETGAADHPGAAESPKGITQYGKKVNAGCPCP